MASVLYQSIEMLSRDKGIEPAVVVGAVEDAIALATRKYYKTQENMRAEMDKETGEIRAYVYKTVVETPEQIEDETNQMTLEQARGVMYYSFHNDISCFTRNVLQIGNHHFSS